MCCVQKNQQDTMQQQQEQNQRFQANLAMQMSEQQNKMMQQSQQFQAQLLGQLAQSLGLGAGAQQPMDPMQSVPMYGGRPMAMHGSGSVPIHTTPDGVAYRQRRDMFSGGGGGSGGQNAPYGSNSQDLDDFTRII